MTTSDGDIVECVDKKSQPAFDNPLLKNHPLSCLESWKLRKEEDRRWNRMSAPQGVQTEPCRYFYWATIMGPNLRPKNPHPGHEYAIVSYEHSTVALYGTKAIVNVWDPAVEEAEMSIAQLWIASGSYETGDLNTIEVGYQVLPTVYKDNMSRLFLFWTGNAYATGCYNVRCSCPGFIQTSGNVVIGGPISPVSSLGGRQSEITINVWKDRKSGNWWLSLGFDNIVGYWPSEIFTTLADHAKYVQWGGEILNNQRLGRHTTTQMGSGHFPNEGFGRSSYFRNLEVVDNQLQSIPIQKLIKKVTSPEYYDVRDLYTEDWKIHFFYGGPGFRFTHSGAATLAVGLPFLFFFVVFFFII